MKATHRIQCQGVRVGLAIAGLCVAGTCLVYAADSTVPSTQQMFQSPADATNALVKAAKAHDRTAVHEIFGPEVTNLFTGDKTQDEANFDSFAATMGKSCTTVPDGPGRLVLEIGADKWPFPIPLIQTNGQWMFDTAAGEEEIVNRHIGEDEFYAIGVCRAYVDAQRKYARHYGHYDANLKTGSDDPENRLALPVAVGNAQVEEHYFWRGERPRPYHGYLFKVLTRQGPDAPSGKMNYMHHRKLENGFALVAFPVDWAQSGVMTFIVNQDGVIRQRSLGETTRRIASEMTEYDPDNQWTPVQDQGITKLDER